jgi:phosphohistidine phosphatase SixA
MIISKYFRLNHVELVQCIAVILLIYGAEPKDYLKILEGFSVTYKTVFMVGHSSTIEETNDYKFIRCHNANMCSSSYTFTDRELG